MCFVLLFIYLDVLSISNYAHSASREITVEFGTNWEVVVTIEIMSQNVP
jgi:hypothetical protein